MSDWLKLLPLELSQIDSFKEPDVDMEPGDNLIGELTPVLKRLYTFWRKLEEAAARNEVDYHYSRQENKEDLKNKSCELEAKARALRFIFWVCLQDEYQTWGKGRVGVRRGFKVVWSDEAPSDFDFLKEFLGG